MSSAFYLSPDEWSNNPALSGPEIQHAHALRLRNGDDVLLLDGEGKIAECKIIRLRKKSMELEVVSETVYPVPRSKAIMAIALGKAARRGFFLEKAAELGAWAIWIWQAKRSQGQIGPGVLESSQARLIAGAKQSLNPWLPRLQAFGNIDEIIAAANSCDWKYVPFENEYPKHMLLPNQLGKPGTGIYVIGPEGGIEQQELRSLLNAEFKPVSLGKRILRCETAATVCLGLHWWAAQLPENNELAGESRHE